MIELIALRQIDVQRGRAVPGQHFVAPADSARWYIRHGWARLARLADSAQLFAGLHRINDVRAAP